MFEIEAKVKKWGNSLGIVLPKERTKSGRIKPNDSLRIWVTKKKESLKVKDIFGTAAFKTPAKNLMKEIDKEFE